MYRNYVLHRPTNVLFYIDVGIKVSAQSLKMPIGAKIWGAWARFWGPVPPWPQHRTATASVPLSPTGQCRIPQNSVKTQKFPSKRANSAAQLKILQQTVFAIYETRDYGRIS